MVNLLLYKPNRGPRLGMGKERRIELLKSMITDLINHERITTTHAKAKALSEYAEGVINLAKQATPDAYDKACGIIRTDAELHKLFTTLALRYHHRAGRYTRVVPLGFRYHDGAKMAIIEFVDRVGEMRPAKQPVKQHPFLPPAAVAYLQQVAAGKVIPPSRTQAAQESIAADDSDMGPQIYIVSATAVQDSSEARGQIGADGDESASQQAEVSSEVPQHMAKDEGKEKVS